MVRACRSLGIGILSARFPPVYCGGAELQAAGVARHLAERHRVSVFTRDGADPTVVEAWRQCNVQVYPRSVAPFPFRPAVDLFTGLRALHKCRYDLDVLLAYQVYIDGLLGVLARRLLDIPVAVSTQSEIEIRSDLSLKSRLASRPILRSSDCITAQSDRLSSIVQAFLGDGQRNGGKRIVVIPNGVDQHQDTDFERMGVLFVGRLVKRKGIEDLLQAARDVPDVRFTIVGDGPEQSRLRSMAGGLPVDFVGRVTQAEVKEYLLRASVLVLPATHGEGVPNVILEAMACGLPVVATANAGVPDIIEDGESGLLVPPSHPQQLARAVRRVLDDRTLWNRLSAGGKQVSARCNWDTVIEMIEGVLYDIVDQKTTGKR